MAEDWQTDMDPLSNMRELTPALSVAADATSSEHEAVTPPTSPTKKRARATKKEDGATPKKPKKSVAVKKDPTDEADVKDEEDDKKKGQPASMAGWNEECWGKLNYAIGKVVHANMATICEYAPELSPWRPKGRLGPKVRQLLDNAQGGTLAKELWKAEQPKKEKASAKE